MKEKECFKCLKVKPLEEFYKHRGMKDGRLNKCIECTKNDVAIHRVANIEAVRKYDRERGRTPERIKKNIARNKIYREKFPDKYKAHSIVGSALKGGKIIRPELCSVCNLSGLQIEAHHDNYSKPLDVTWLCAACHRQLHRDLKKQEETICNANY